MQGMKGSFFTKLNVSFFYARSISSNNSYSSNNCNSNSNNIIYSACNKMFQSKECKDCQCRTFKQCKVQLACKDCNKINSYRFNQIIRSRFWRNKKVTILFSTEKNAQKFLPTIFIRNIYLLRSSNCQRQWNIEPVCR